MIPGNDDSAKAVTLYAVASPTRSWKAANAVNDVVKAAAGSTDEFVEVQDSAA